MGKYFVSYVWICVRGIWCLVVIILTTDKITKHCTNQKFNRFSFMYIILLLYLDFNSGLFSLIHSCHLYLYCCCCWSIASLSKGFHFYSSLFVKHLIYVRHSFEACLKQHRDNKLYCCSSVIFIALLMIFIVSALKILINKWINRIEIKKKKRNSLSI